MGFNLTKNNLAEKSEVGHKFELLIPEINEKTGAFVTVRGVQSAKVKAYSRRKFAEMQQEQQMAKRKGKEPREMTLDEAEDMAIEAAIVRIIDWEGITEDGKDGKEVKVVFNEENARRILREHSWIREQILNESDLLTNFI
jgi:hypothetical protein